MKYTEGIIQEISKKAVWRKAILEGCYTFRDVIFMETYITIETMHHDILILKCNKEIASKYKENQAVNIYYNGEGIQEMYPSLEKPFTSLFEIISKSISKRSKKIR